MVTGRIWTLLQEVPDPEIPVISIVDLGVVRDVKIKDDCLEVVMTPTYSGCPAMGIMEIDVLSKLAENGFDDVKVSRRLSPAWTTDWMSDAGRDKLKQYGIAAPIDEYKGCLPCAGGLIESDMTIHCPQCGSAKTECISPFGSTACKANYRCLDCLEPFDYFKAI